VAGFSAAVRALASTWLMRPAFSANHRWAMHMGETSLRLELRRRRAPDAAAAGRVPAPPGPTFARLTRPPRDLA
jgi:hypothetical protein